MVPCLCTQAEQPGQQGPATAQPPGPQHALLRGGAGAVAAPVALALPRRVGVAWLVGAHCAVHPALWWGGVWKWPLAQCSHARTRAHMHAAVAHALCAAHTQPQGQAVYLCDYLLPGETEGDAAERAAELLAPPGPADAAAGAPDVVVRGGSVPGGINTSGISTNDAPPRDVASGCPRVSSSCGLVRRRWRRRAQPPSSCRAGTHTASGAWRWLSRRRGRGRRKGRGRAARLRLRRLAWLRWEWLWAASHCMAGASGAG